MGFTLLIHDIHTFLVVGDSWSAIGCATYMSVASMQIRINVDRATRTKTSSTSCHCLMAWRCMGGRREGVSMCSCEREGVKWMLVEEVSLVDVKCRRMLCAKWKR